MIEIRSHYTGIVLLTLDADSLKGANLSDAQLKHASLLHADLSGANLSNADLSGAILYEADLSGANLKDACLAESFLNSACMKDVTLIGANLARANLSYADLSGANLDRAYLQRAYFLHTDLTNTFLGNTRGSEAVFACCATLHLARGLEEALISRQNSQGAVVLDQRTLRACLQHLPDAFLHNCGYTLGEITGMRTMYAEVSPPDPLPSSE